ncbi:ribonucleotide-diphosphate reductase subunit alpha, partial [Klebsiella michiganensis]
VKSCSQGGVRGGAATLFYPMWHLEVESLLVLKNNRGTDANRVRHMDYGVQINKLMYTRLLKGGDITLFSPSDVPGLYDAFFADQDEFERLYTQYEQDDSIRKQRIKAVELFSLMMQERASTGRIYIQNVDHCNTHSPFDPVVAPVRQSNLCLEIALPTKPLEDVNDENGEIALCTLSAFNLGVIDSLDELEELAVLAVRALDALLDYQDYPIPAAKRGAMGRRTLGIGVINFAYYLAKHGKRFSDGSANNAIVSESLHYDWEQLRESIKTHGLRNSTLSALMPSETSSQISNATNGIEPPRGHVSIKASKDGILRQVVPDYEKLQNGYELLWEMPNNDGYLQLVGIMQKFIDQSISANTNYDPTRFPSGKVPMQQLLKDLLNAYKFGVKTLYYHNTRDGAEDAQDDLAPSIQDDGCESGACKI